MKNLHIISSNNPSRLVKIYNDVNRETFTLKLDVEVNDSFKEYVNIYITSDERPSSNDYYIIDDIHEVLKNTFLKFIDSKCKKIILTTDQDLTKDGVQAIDDEFLEWFVENPSCESVEVKPLLSNNGNVLFGYKIIIPKEETKPKTMLESLQEYLKNTSKEKVLEDWNEFQHLDNEGITVNEFLENQKQIDEKEK